MKAWLRKWWWAVIAGTILVCVIGWEEKRCQSQADQCRADYAAELLLNRSSTSQSSWLGVDEGASKQQAINAACEPNSYFCRLFGPANLPTVLLVLIGAIGIWSALKSLSTIEQQTVHAKNAANAALLTATAAVNTSRPWLLIPMGTEFSEIPDPLLPSVGDNRVCHVTFPLHNFGQTPARIVEQKVRLYIGQGTDAAPDVSAFTSENSIMEDYVIPQGSRLPVQAYLEPGMNTFQADKAKIIAGTAYLWLCGFVRYRMASDSERNREPFETRFCYLWINRSNRPSPFWILRGPHKYSKAT